MFAINKENKKNYMFYIFLKKLSLSIVHNKYGYEYEQMFKEEESTEILNIFSLIIYIEEHQKTYKHAWRKHKSII